jgi:organic hydroperoxide reductase OsmC/OhrA
MADLKQIHAKKEPQYFFEVKLDRLEGTEGLLTADDASDSIKVGLPDVFGGDKDEWNPEHLFLASISSCYMTTFLSFAKKLSFDIAHFACHAIGQVSLVDGRFQFTRIDIYPKIFITKDELHQKANLAMEKTQKYCLVSNSVKTEIIYHGQVLKQDDEELDQAV